MRNVALAMKDEYEVPVSSTEVLEANVAAIRESLNEFKLEVRAAFSNINSEIKSLYGETKSLHGEIRSLRERNDKNFERLSTKVDADLKETRKELGELKETVLKIDSRQGAVLWVGGGLAALITLAVTIGKAFKLF